MCIEKYSIIVLLSPKNLNIFRKAVLFYQKNLNPKEIVVICNREIEDDVNRIEGVRCVDEEIVFPGLSFKSVAEIIHSRTGEKGRPGWYLQQFLKLAWCYHEEKDYIVFDSDTIPLVPISFRNDYGKLLFTKKIEYNKPYFETIHTLFDGKIDRVGDFSFVAENMIFRSIFVKEMLELICSNERSQGNSFWEIILYSITKDNLLVSGFSEYETYGNYVMTMHPGTYELRSLRTQREAVYLLGPNPSHEQLEWAARDYDVISIDYEDYPATLTTRMTSLKIIRHLLRLKTIAFIRTKVRTAYRKIKGKKDFVFEENKLF